MLVIRILTLNIAFMFFFGSFSLENQCSIDSIEVFYFENKGAWINKNYQLNESIS